MKILVWQCQCCNRECILKFDGTKHSIGGSGFVIPDFCIRDVACETDLWKLRKLDEAKIIKYFIDGNIKWRKNKNKDR